MAVRETRLRAAARKLDAAWSLMMESEDDGPGLERVIQAIAEMRAALDGASPPARRVGRVNPAEEAAALMAEWVDVYQRTDEAWTEVYTPEELEAVRAEIGLAAAQLPSPAASLFHRLHHSGRRKP